MKANLKRTTMSQTSYQALASIRNRTSHRMTRQQEAERDSGKAPQVSRHAHITRCICQPCRGATAGVPRAEPTAGAPGALGHRRVLLCKALPTKNLKKPLERPRRLFSYPLGPGDPLKDHRWLSSCPWASSDEGVWDSQAAPRAMAALRLSWPLILGAFEFLFA